MEVSPFRALQHPLATPLHVRAAYGLLRGLVGLLFSLDVIGRESLPQTGPYILVANHISRLDPLLLLAAFPLQPRIWFLAATIHTTDIPWRRRLLGWTGGIIPVQEGSITSGKRVLRDAIAVLRAGGVVGIFPEGQVGPEQGDLQAMHAGAATIALRAGVPLLPVWIAGSQRVWWRKRIQLIVGQPFYPPQSDERSDAVAALTGALQQLHPLATPVVEPPRPLGLWLNRLL